MHQDPAIQERLGLFGQTLMPLVSQLLRAT
jgi:hypothetical protein